MALTLAATPLGNPLDASPRLKAAIENAEISDLYSKGTFIL